MNLDPGYLFASMIVSGVGFVVFKYGRGQRRVPHTAIGFVLMVFPYAISGVWTMLGIGAGLCALLWIATRLGM
jgi:hypothetical protein